jgi:membrane protease YdiL (CAAX protease family)
MVESPPLPPDVPAEKQSARWRWAIHLLVLSLYPLLLGFAAAMRQAGKTNPMLPTRVGPLLAALSVEMLLFCAVFAVALSISRPRWNALWLGWKGRLQPIIRGFLYSLALRASLAVLMLVIAAGAFLATGGRDKLGDKLRPEAEELVDAKALVENPGYLVLNLTLVSFVFAGFREELWRVGMLAAFNALLPGGFAKSSGRWLAIGFSAVVFGLGHLPQGWGGVLLTGVLGAGLAMIILWHRSIWEAVLAHGFFDATTFLLLYAIARFRPDLIPGGH